MGKQPYIPFYIGDYLKDTRVLPLSVRGAWVDIILFMWDNPVRGELIGTVEEFSRMMSCEPKEAEFALNLLKQKKTADIDLLPDKTWKIVSRRMKADSELSKKRSIAGKNGVVAKFAKPFAKAKPQANTEYEGDIENDIEELLKGLDEIYLDAQRPKWKLIDFDFELQAFREKVRGSPKSYIGHEVDGIRLAFQSQLRHARKNDRTGGKKTTTGTRNNFSGNYGETM